MHTSPFASSSHLSIIPTRLSLEYISAHNLVITLPPSSGAQAHYERHPPQLSKCSIPPPLQFSPPEERRRARPRFCAPYLQTLSRGPLWTRLNLMGVVSGLSIVGKRMTRTTPPRRHDSRSIVGTTAIGRAKKNYLSLSSSLSRSNPRPSAPDPAHRMGVVSGLSIVGKRIDQDHAAAPPRTRSIVGTTAIGRAQKKLPLSLSPSRGLTTGCLLQTRPTAWAWSLVSQ